MSHESATALNRNPSPSSSQRPEASDPAALAHDIRMACMRVARQVRLDGAGDLPAHHLSALARLTEAPGAAGDLAERERVSAPSMTRTIAALVEQGLVVRQPDASDGRVTLLAPTQQGRDFVVKEKARRDGWMAARLEGMSEHERDVLAQAAVLLGQVATK